MNKWNYKSITMFAIGLVAVAVAARVIPHPPNFAPIAALAIFGGLYLPKRTAVILPLTAMLISDAMIGFYTPEIMVAVYGCFILIGLFAMYIKPFKSPWLIFGTTLLGSVAFFLATNAAVWHFGTMYDPGIPGLIQSYVAGLPFFKNTLLGDLFYVTFLSVSFEVLTNSQQTRTLTALHPAHASTET